MPTVAEAFAIAVQHHQAGELQAAEQIYRQIIAVDPNHVDALHLLGIAAFQAGKPEIAETFIRRAIELNGTEAGFHSNLANALHSQEKLDESIACYHRALELNPASAETSNDLGTAYQDQGKLNEAIECYRRALSLEPNLVAAHCNLGNAFKDQENLDEAIVSYRRAMELDPTLPEAHNNLGNTFQAQEKHAEAIACFQQAISLRPDYSDPHSNLGNSLQAQGKLDAAVAECRRALELKPEFADAHNNLGTALQAQGKLDDAIASYRRALLLKPAYAVAHNNLGTVLHAKREIEEAIDAYRRALQLKPDFAEAHSNLGATYQAQGKLDEAVACCRRAVELKPGFAGAQSNLGNAFKDQGKLDEAVACYDRALQLKPESFEAQSSRLYTLWFCRELDSAAICDEHSRWYQQWAQPLSNDIPPHTNDATPNRRLRIGYVSPDFRNHCQALFTLPLFAAHDHQQFEIVCYSDVLSPDTLTSRLRSCVDHWREIVGLSDADIAQMVRQDQIDILVDLTMHMERGRLLTFARKPAPVQISWLAYPGTTGLKTIDYRLTDPHLDPPGLNDRHYSEQSIRLPDTFWCYDPLTDAPAVNALPALTNGYVTFGCLNNFCKVNADVLRLWARVLGAVERSRMLLLAPEGSTRENVLEVLYQGGISADRVTFVARKPRQEYLELYNQIDIGLDTFPYNGHTTSLDSFWMGVPVVTLVGETVVGRAGLCQLHNLGLPELIAHTPDQFVEISASLANDLPRMSQLRETLRDTIEQSPLMDAPRFARNIEAAYRALWHDWCVAPGRTLST